MIFHSDLTIAYINKSADRRTANAILGLWKHGENAYDIEIYLAGQSYNARILSRQSNSLSQLARKTKNEGFDITGVDEFRRFSDIELIKGLSFNKITRKWENGILFDPVSGKMSKAKIWLKEKDLLVLRRIWYFNWLGTDISFTRVVK